MGDMSIFRGKKALFFVALAYHNRILLPVARALEELGCKAEYFCTQAEAGFEINLNELGLPYYHASDFFDAHLSAETNASYRTISQQVKDLFLHDVNLQSVPLVIFDKILRGCIEAFYGFRALLDTVKPDMVYALTEVNSWGKMLGYLCMERGIAYGTWQEGLCYSHVGMYRGHTEYSDACMIWGEADKRMLVSAGNDPARMPIVGNIDLAATITDTCTPERIADVKTNHDIPSQNDVLLILMGHASYSHLSDTGFIHWLWAHPTVTCVFKFHPIQQKDLVQNAMQTFGQIPSVKVVLDGDTYGLMAAARACVLIGASTTGIEALAYNKPLVEIVLPDSTYSYAALGACPSAASLEEAVTLTWKLADEGETSEWYEKRQAYLKDHFYGYDDGKFDGRTVERVLDVMATVLEQKQCLPN